MLSTRRHRAIFSGAVLLAALAAAAPACRRAPSAAAETDAPPPAATPGTPVPAARPARVSVAAEPAAVAAGGSATLLWRFEPAAGWHLYWDGRNDSGFAPRLALRLPPGWSAGPLRWPAPERHLSAGDILDHVYTGPFTLLQDVTAPAGAVAGDRVTLGARWDWLACRDACVPGRDSLTVALTVAATGTAGAARPSAALAAARDRLPSPLPDGFLRHEWRGAACVLRRVRDVPGGTLTFLPAGDCGELADLLHDGAGAELALRCLPRDGRCGPVRGVLVAAAPGEPARAFQLDVPAVPAPADAAPAPSTVNPTGGPP